MTTSTPRSFPESLKQKYEKVCWVGVSLGPWTAFSTRFDTSSTRFRSYPSRNRFTCNGISSSKSSSNPNGSGASTSTKNSRCPVSGSRRFHYHEHTVWTKYEYLSGELSISHFHPPRRGTSKSPWVLGGRTLRREEIPEPRWTRKET